MSVAKQYSYTVKEVEMKNWEWQVRCNLCGTHSTWLKSRFIAKILAIAHSIIRHPFGHTTISARESNTGKEEVKHATQMYLSKG